MHRSSLLLRVPVPSPPPRNGRLLRLAFGSLLGPQACAEVVEEARTAAQAALDRLAQERADLEQEADPGAPYRRLVLSAGEHAARAQLAWAEESLAVLRGLPATGGGTTQPVA